MWAEQRIPLYYRLRDPRSSTSLTDYPRTIEIGPYLLLDKLQDPAQMMEDRNDRHIIDPIEEMLSEILTPSELVTSGAMLRMQILETIYPILSPWDSSTGSIFRTKSYLRSNYRLRRDRTSIYLIAKAVYEEIYGQETPNETDREQAPRESITDDIDMTDCFSVDSEESALKSSIPTAGMSESTFMMSGARPEGCQLPVLQHSHLDTVVCTDDMLSQATYQPFRIMQMQELQTYDILENVQNWSALGDGFLITPFGLCQALADASRSKGSADVAIIEALVMRGGRVPASLKSKQVIYPEDLVPFADVLRNPIDNSYWELIYAQGRIWDEW